jgi:hypothetical protein
MCVGSLCSDNDEARPTAAICTYECFGFRRFWAGSEAACKADGWVFASGDVGNQTGTEFSFLFLGVSREFRFCFLESAVSSVSDGSVGSGFLNAGNLTPHSLLTRSPLTPHSLPPHSIMLHAHMQHQQPASCSQTTHES